MATRDDRLKNELKHECELPPEEDILGLYINSGCFIKTRRRIRHFFLLSESNPRIRIFLKSAFVIRRDRRRHLKYHYYMIHPFSNFRLCWEVFMMFIFFILLVIIPIGMASQLPTFMHLKISFDVICWVDILLTFNTGYQSAITSKIIMNRWMVAKNYITGWFVIDFISSVSWEMLNSVAGLAKDERLQYVTFLKALRAITFFKYIDQFRDHKQYSVFKFKVFKLSLMVFLIFLWVSCVTYITDTELKKSNLSLLEIILFIYRRAMYMLLLFGTPEESMIIDKVLVEIACLTIGFVLQLLVISQILQIVSKYSSSNKKYYQMTQQVQEFMRYKNLPANIRKRVLSYFDFCFQQNYYREGEILKMLSPQLMQEMLLHTHMHLLEHVHIFEDLPLSILCKIISHMKSEIYLPSDVVVTAGTIGDSMYFIGSGTVAVYTASGKEVCHLSDGANFGEIALITDNEYRVATVVAIDCCEIFILHRKDFTKQVERFPEVYERLQKIAQDRVKKNIIGKMSGDDQSDIYSVISDSGATSSSYKPRRSFFNI